MISAPQSTVFRENNPQRPVDWRWQLAGELLGVAYNYRMRGKDADVKLCRRFRKALDAVRHPGERLRLLTLYPDMYEAWSLYAASDDVQLRWELEARILAGESFESIATKLAMPLEAVRLYESCFFHVTDRLQSPSYITQVVFGRSIHSGLHAREYDLLWKMYGYWGGPLVLDQLVFRFAKQQRPESVESVRGFWSDDLANTMRLNAAIAARVAPITEDTYEAIINTYLKMVAAEKNAGNTPNEGILTNIQSMLVNIPWHLVPAGRTRPLSDDAVDVADVDAAALRAGELEVVSELGHVPPDIVKLTGNMAFPEETNHDQDQKIDAGA